MPWSLVCEGGFEPSGIEGFNASRLGHLAVLRTVLAATGPGLAYVYGAIALYTAMTVAWLIVAWLTLRAYAPSNGATWWRGAGVLLAALTPMIVYTGGKVSPDVPALLASALAAYATLRSLRSLRGRWVWLLLAAACLAYAGMTKSVSSYQYVSLAIAAVLWPPEGERRWPMAWRCGVVGAGALMLFVAAAWSQGLSKDQLVAFYSSAAGSRAATPLAVKLAFTAATLGWLWLLLPLSLFSRRRGEAIGLWVWWLVVAVPLVTMVPRMEMRYLTVGVVPLAGLLGLGCEVLVEKVKSLRRPRVGAIASLLAAALLAATAWAVQPFTAHEVELSSLRRVIAKAEAEGGDELRLAAAWDYCGFLLLRVLRPDLPVYSAFHPTPSGSVTRDAQTVASEATFADLRILDASDLRRLGGDWLMIGADEPFPIASMRALAQRLPQSAQREKILTKLSSLHGWDPLMAHWLAGSPQIDAELVYRDGPYQLVRLELRGTSAAPGGPAGAGDGVPAP